MSRHSNQTEIGKDNVNQLEVKWILNTGSTIEDSPLIVGNTGYVQNNKYQVIAFDMDTGLNKWKYDPKTGSSPAHGIAYDNGVIYAPTGPNGTVVALNADNGKKIWESPALQPRGGSFVLTSPPLVWKDYVILGSAFGDVVLQGAPATKGTVTALDKKGCSMETKLTGSKSKICSPQGDEHKISLPEFLQRLGVDESGLSEQEAARRLQECGPNVLEETGKESILSKYIRQFRNFFSILLIIGAILSFLGEYLDPGKGNLYIGIALGVVVILNGTFTFVQEYQAAKTMESFRQLLPPRAKVLREGKVRDVLASELVVGEIILLEEGDKVPADGRLIETNSLKVDHSTITGEAEPQLRSLECTNSKILECRNMVFSGTLVQSGNGKAVVFGTGQNTQIGNLAILTEQISSVDTPIRRELNRFIKIISAIAIFMGVTFFILAFLLQDTFLASLIFAIGIIVANVPEGLLPTVTLALSLASRRMASRNALIKNLESVETLGSTTVICTDKTGTLTQNRMAVNSLIVGFESLVPKIPSDLEKRVAEQEAEESTKQGIAGKVTGSGAKRVYVVESPIWDPKKVPPALIRVAGLCNNAKLRELPTGYTGDPTEGALLVFANSFQDIKTLQSDYPRLKEFPFDSLTRRMEVICHTPEGKLEVYLKGAPEVVVKMCGSVMDSGEVTETGRN